jgi:hypothetical protein
VIINQDLEERRETLPMCVRCSKFLGALMNDSFFNGVHLNFKSNSPPCFPLNGYYSFWQNSKLFI